MQKRLLKEYQGTRGYFLTLAREDSLQEWIWCYHGPDDSFYARSIYHISLKIPSEYPLVPPTATFTTPIFHPNTGEICLDILKDAWTPAWTIARVCEAIAFLMLHPEPDSPLNCDAANLLRVGDTRAFRSLAQMYIQEKNP